MESAKIVISLLALFLFALSVVSVKLKWDENYRFIEPMPLAHILLIILYSLTLILGFIASIWDIIDIF